MLLGSTKFVTGYESICYDQPPKILSNILHNRKLLISVLTLDTMSFIAIYLESLIRSIYPVDNYYKEMVELAFHSTKTI